MGAYISGRMVSTSDDFTVVKKLFNNGHKSATNIKKLTEVPYGLVTNPDQSLVRRYLEKLKLKISF
jgi:hypothetical protein